MNMVQSTFLIIVIIDSFIDLEVSMSIDHEVSGSIPGTSIVLNVN